MGVGSGPNDYYRHHDWNIACSMCGRKLKAGDSVRNWQGQYRHLRCDEPRQPQDFARGIVEDMSVPYCQTEQVTFVFTCSLNTQSGIPGVGSPGCMRPGNKLWSPAFL